MFIEATSYSRHVTKTHYLTQSPDLAKLFYNMMIHYINIQSGLCMVHQQYTLLDTYSRSGQCILQHKDTL